MAKGTKEKLLESAIEIFARDGYAGANIKDIAEKVGIVKSAFYRHFESKEEIWNAVFEMMISYYDTYFGPNGRLAAVPKNTDELYEMTVRMMEFTVQDKKIVQMRRILLTEQFRDEKVRKLASHYFLYDTEAIFTKVFTAMMENGSLKKTDAATLAFAYTSPITALIHLCDREPEKLEEAVKKAQDFIRAFIEEYGLK